MEVVHPHVQQASPGLLGRVQSLVARADGEEAAPTEGASAAAVPAKGGAGWEARDRRRRCPRSRPRPCLPSHRNLSEDQERLLLLAGPCTGRVR
jgi:hypothetical protein